MSRARVGYRCRACGTPAVRWAGRCGQCGEWNTLDEEIEQRRAITEQSASRRAAADPPVELLQVDPMSDEQLPTGLSELDRVLGGGLVRSSVTLIAGEPGIGKSTLLLEMLAAVAAGGRRALLISAEESPGQVRRRAARLGALTAGLWIAAETELPALRSAIRSVQPDVVVVDSIQTVSDPETGPGAGTVAQVRACSQALTDDAKCGGPAVVLVGHVTKDGSIAGPRVLEHLVDTVLTFEGDRHHGLRMLRSVKHRFGPVGELGIWEMTAGGLAEVADAGALLVGDRQPGAPGSVVFAAMDGRRPLLVEVQALVAAATGPVRRSSSGYEGPRLAQLLAVLERRAGLALGGSDVYVSAVGGVRLGDPGADLAVALAVASAATGSVVPEDLVVLGEIGLGGEIRQVSDGARRLSEAARHGFRRALAPPRCEAVPAISVDSVSTLVEALDLHLGRRATAPVLRILRGDAASHQMPVPVGPGRHTAGAAAPPG